MHSPEDINWQSFSGFSCMEALRSGSISIADSIYYAGEAAFGKEGALFGTFHLIAIILVKLSGRPNRRPGACALRRVGEVCRRGSGLCHKRCNMSDALGSPHLPLYLDDLSVGQRFESTEATLDEPQIRRFAEEFDPQPFHLSAEAAQGTLFDGLVASGWHTAATTMRLIVSSLPIAGGIIGAGAEIKWPRPTRPGDTIKVEILIIEIKASVSRSHRGIARIQATTINQNNETVQELQIAIVVPRRPPATLAGY